MFYYVEHVHINVLINSYSIPPLVWFWSCIHWSVSCFPSPQLTLPEGTLPRWGHTVTACRMCPGRVHATTFGGCPYFVHGQLDVARPKIAETTVMEFGEQNTLCILYCIVCSLTHCIHTVHCTVYTDYLIHWSSVHVPPFDLHAFFF